MAIPRLTPTNVARKKPRITRSREIPRCRTRSPEENRDRKAPPTASRGGRSWGLTHPWWLANSQARRTSKGDHHQKERLDAIWKLLITNF
jgi:hypothetical protein